MKQYALRSMVVLFGVSLCFLLTNCEKNKFKDPSIITVNGVELEMMPIEGGNFTMGGNSVTVSSFYIGKTEVTQALWQTVTGYTPTSDGDQWSDVLGKGNNYPAYFINDADIQNFISKLNSLTGLTFRLPTEAEWEYAARGGNKSNGYTYSGSNNINSVAWYVANVDSKGCKPVAQKLPNELGIYDMSGNVWEWCEGAATRGGSVGDNSSLCSVTYSGTYPYGRGKDHGFRLVFVP